MRNCCCISKQIFDELSYYIRSTTVFPMNTPTRVSNQV